jgi:hypothetical protein
LEVEQLDLMHKGDFIVLKIAGIHDSVFLFDTLDIEAFVDKYKNDSVVDWTHSLE